MFYTSLIAFGDFRWHFFAFLYSKSLKLRFFVFTSKPFLTLIKIERLYLQSSLRLLFSPKVVILCLSRAIAVLYYSRLTILNVLKNRF